MGEERMALEGLNDCDDAIVAADPQVIALSDVVGEDNSRSLADSREHSKQNSAFERLGLIDDHKRFVE
jgi:hypothetical protein